MRYHTARSSYSSSPYSSPTLPARATPVKPSSSRKVVTNFATFGASPPTHSIFGTAALPPQPTFGSTSTSPPSFGGIRGAARGGGLDEDEEEDDGRQKIEMREDAITFDQVSFLYLLHLLFTRSYKAYTQARRIAMQSAWRSARA